MSELSINFKYIFPDEYNPVYANGVFGGVSPQGEIVVNFFFERNPIPYSETRNVDDNGQLTEVIKIDPQEHDTNVLRVISNGVILNLQSAKAINEWLTGKIIELESRGK